MIIEKLKAEFITEAIDHHIATLDGNSKKANKSHRKIMKIYAKVKDMKRQDIFIEYLNHSNDGVRLWAASFLLKTDPELAMACLNKLVKLPTITSSDAEMTLKLWKNNELELL